MSSRWLFPIELRGIGTEEIECIPSYLIRAGIALGIGPGQIMSHTVDRLLSATTYEDAASPRFEPITSYIRPNRSTEQLVESLDEGTGINGFRRGTFLALKDAVDRSMGAFSKHFKWCPICFEEFEQQEDKGYFKLIWQLNSVTHCHIHHTPLSHQCPRCNKTQVSTRYRSRCIDCVHCKKPLTHQYLRFDKKPDMAAKTTDLRILVKEIATHQSLSYPIGGVRSLLDAVFNEFWAQGDDLKMWKRIPRDTYLTIIDGTKPVTLETVRSIAFRLGMTIPELLRGRLTNTTQILDPAWTENIPKEFKPQRQRTRHDVAKLEEGIQKALKEPDKSSKSLKEVAEGIGVTEWCLRNRFPSACETIIKRYQNRVQIEEMDTRMKIRAAVTSFLSSHPIGSATPHGIVSTIYRETGLPRERIRKAVEEYLCCSQPAGDAPAKRKAKPTRKPLEP